MQTEEYASQEQAIEAIHALTDADYQKLMLIARYWHHQRYGRLEDRIKPEEILSEAIARTLEPGRRNWRKKKVSIVKHLDRVMESLSGHVLEERVVQTRVKEELESEMDRTEENRPYPRSSVEDEVVARQQLEIVQTIFADNELALHVLHGRAEENTAAEIRVKLGLSETEYASVTRLILRRFVKHAKILGGIEDERKKS